MIQALNPYPSKTDEIMSRYRPIAPKPELPLATSGAAVADGGSMVVPEKFRQSPYLQNIWSHLQARPTRTRKRGRSAATLPASMLKKQQQMKQQHQHQKLLEASLMASRSFSFYSETVPSPPPPPPVTLPLLQGGESKSGVIDLNADVTPLEERDLVLQLGSSRDSSCSTNNSSSNNNNNRVVISPRPVRPVGSTISVVGPITEDPGSVVRSVEEVEAEDLPTVVSDRRNRVRMANSAYKELVGQPECPWLDSMTTMFSSDKRIGGEVVLRLEEVGDQLPGSGTGFSCWVRIEWESEGKKNSVNAFSDVVRMCCDQSKDYVFSWRFHTREVSPSGSKV